MSPHADYSTPPQHNNQPLRSVHRATQPKMHRNTSYLRPSSEDELHDIICVGFGPASLGIAVAMHDAIEASGHVGQLDRLPKVAFLEKQPEFRWHAGMLLEGAHMQISFIKDMASLRNPRSNFTYLNYLHKNDRLIDFTNLNTFLPPRVEYEDYLRWCASHFDDVTSYGQEVVQVVPEKTTIDSAAVDSFVVKSRNTVTGETTSRRARHVVIATGGRAKIPEPFPKDHPKVIHSSAFKYTAPKLLPERNAPYKIAVIGGGQSAAEIFENLQTNYPNSNTNLIIRAQHLRPSDDSPFVNEIFNPERTDDMFSRDPELRTKTILDDKVTNYGVVRLNLLERLFETMYLQKMKYGAQENWPHRILNFRTVVEAGQSPVIKGGVRLVVNNHSNDFCARKSATEEVHDYDLVVVAVGYERNEHEDILQGSRWLMPGGGSAGQKWEVNRHYGVLFEEGKVSPDAGIWLQGCNEMTHGLSDTLLSVLAIRSQEVVSSIFGPQVEHSNGVHHEEASQSQNGHHASHQTQLQA
ncbi:FAD-dependent pyridine nucleotide-disulfide oxidoreductase [Lasiodiplodia theobromae]|uniref:L-ornithine N(5)-monooxygenase [NAD(P)H] n=1 Tax=Lasiodiplodia theobromae TaxID=45133 RepID=A0A5N5DGT9_9PEZI|nr:L-ornithine N(5)-monooxygenase [Lasiodiplodia theobromae]KAF9631536.1 FAD-dependent pyridine nucleotide-disulfide oxidoreductase [Lasiodiplodia theobromae]